MAATGLLTSFDTSTREFAKASSSSSSPSPPPPRMAAAPSNKPLVASSGTMKWLTHNVSAALSALGGTWEQQFARLETFHRLYGHCEVPSNPAFLVATHCQRLREKQ